jgi:hypothetical protein
VPPPVQHVPPVRTTARVNYPYPPNVACADGEILGMDGCVGGDYYMSEPTEVFLGLTFSEADARLKGRSDETTNVIYPAGFIMPDDDYPDDASMNAYGKFEVQYYDTPCRNGYTRNASMNVNSMYSILFCEGTGATRPDRILTCNAGDVLDNLECIAPIIARETYL